MRARRVAANDRVGQEARPPERTPLSRLLRDRDEFRRLWFGTLATQGGQWVLQVAIGWLMLDLTDSEFWVGLSGFTGGLPMLALALPAGIATDRFERRRLLVGCQAGLCALGFAFAVLAAIDAARPVLLLAGAALNGALMTINNTARQAMVPSTVRHDEVTTAIGLNSAAQNASRVVGPSLAGLCIAIGGVSAAFALQAGLLALALSLSIGLSVGVIADAGSRVSGGALQGLRVVWHTRLLRDLVVLAAIPTLVVFPYIQLLPVYARDILHIGPQGLGLLLASSGSGAVLGALLVARRPVDHRPGWWMLALTLAYCGIVLGFSVSQWVWVSIPLLVLAGVTGSAYLSINAAVLLLHVDDSVRGRVVGVSMLTWGLMPIGALPMGALAGILGAPTAIAACAALAAALTLALAVRSPALRAL